MTHRVGKGKAPAAALRMQRRVRHCVEGSWAAQQQHESDLRKCLQEHCKHFFHGVEHAAAAAAAS